MEAVGRNHVLVLPKPVLALRTVQLFFALIILALASYGVYWWSYDGDDLILFTAIATMIITVYVIAAERAPMIYNYWAILGLDIFAIVFWVISFSLLASEVASWVIYTDNFGCTTDIFGDVVCYKKRSLGLSKRFWTTSPYRYRDSMAAASALGGLEFILFVITLTFTGVGLHRHRKAGGHSMPNSAMPNSAVPNSAMPNSATEMETKPGGVYPPQGAYAPQSYPSPQPTPQPAYPQQPYSPAPQYQYQQPGPQPVYPQQQPVPVQT
jgi:hypothetical protein